MSHPKYLSLLKDKANLNIRRKDGITAFVMSWILWEAVRTRLLILKYRLNGHTVKSARFNIMQAKISSNNGFIKAFNRLPVGDNWEVSLDNVVTKKWNRIKQLENVRHQLVHGSRSYYDGELLRDANEVIEFIELLLGHSLGNPFEKIKG